MNHLPIHRISRLAVADGAGVPWIAGIRFDSLFSGITELGRRREISILTLLVLIRLIGN